MPWTQIPMLSGSNVKDLVDLPKTKQKQIARSIWPYKNVLVGYGREEEVYASYAQCWAVETRLMVGLSLFTNWGIWNAAYHQQMLWCTVFHTTQIVTKEQYRKPSRALREGFPWLETYYWSRVVVDWRKKVDWKEIFEFIHSVGTSKASAYCQEHRTIWLGSWITIEPEDDLIQWRGSLTRPPCLVEKIKSPFLIIYLDYRSLILATRVRCLHTIKKMAVPESKENMRSFPI